MGGDKRRRLSGIAREKPNLQPEREKVKVSSGQSEWREARERRRKAQWKRIGRKKGFPSLIPEGEETNSVCRENETQSARAWKLK